MARHGLLNTVFSDNGLPYYSHEFSKFAEEFDFEHVTSSPGFPQSNGRAENAVKTAKRLLTNRKQVQTKYYNVGSKELENLKIGDVVRIKPQRYNSRWIKARVERKADVRSYEVRTEDGAVFRRNRRHLRKTQESPVLPREKEVQIMPKVLSKPEIKPEVHREQKNIKR